MILLDIKDTIGSVVRLLSHNKGSFYFAVFLCILGGITELIGVGTLYPFLALLAKPALIHSNTLLNFVFKYGNFQSINSFLLFSGWLALIVYFLSSLFLFLKNSYIIRFCVGQSAHISVKVLDSYLRKPMLYHLEKNSGALSKDVIGQSDQFTNGVLIAVMTIFGDGIILIVLFCVVLFINIHAGLIVFTILGVLVGTALISTKNKVIELSNKNDFANGERFNFCIGALQSVKEIKTAGKEEFFCSLYRKHAESFSRCYADVNIVQMLPQSIIQFVAAGTLISIAIFHISAGVEPAVIVPALAMYAVVGYRLLPSFNRLSSALSQLQQFKPIISNITEVLAQTTPSESSIDSTTLPEYRSGAVINFQSIDFSYPGAEHLLFQDFNLVLENNTFTCIVGSSGAGKSTLVDLLLGLLPANSGTVLLDGKSIDQLGEPQWRAVFGYVPQSIYLLDGSIEENIAFGVPKDKIDRERLAQIVSLCHLNDFISLQPDGLNAHVGERGGKLSGGQRQRIGIARALYSDPAVLILDESTSSLDGISEAWIIETLKELKKTKTIISIAHRSSLVRNSDRVILIEDGSIAGDGNYQELCKANPKFVSLMSEMEKHGQ